MGLGGITEDLLVNSEHLPKGLSKLNLPPPSPFLPSSLSLPPFLSLPTSLFHLPLPLPPPPYPSPTSLSVPQPNQKETRNSHQFVWLTLYPCCHHFCYNPALNNMLTSWLGVRGFCFAISESGNMRLRRQSLITVFTIAFWIAGLLSAIIWDVTFVVFGLERVSSRCNGVDWPSAQRSFWYILSGQAVSAV